MVSILVNLRNNTALCCDVVLSFAKQTGDYHVLSRPDIKVIALTYQLECELSEKHGAQLRTKPIKQVGQLL